MHFSKMHHLDLFFLAGGTGELVMQKRHPAGVVAAEEEEEEEGQGGAAGTLERYSGVKVR